MFTNERVAERKRGRHRGKKR